MAILLLSGEGIVVYSAENKEERFFFFFKVYGLHLSHSYINMVPMTILWKETF